MAKSKSKKKSKSKSGKSKPKIKFDFQEWKNFLVSLVRTPRRFAFVLAIVIIIIILLNPSLIGSVVGKLINGLKPLLIPAIVVLVAIVSWVVFESNSTKGKAIFFLLLLCIVGGVINSFYPGVIAKEADDFFTAMYPLAWKLFEFAIVVFGAGLILKMAFKKKSK